MKFALILSTPHPMQPHHHLPPALANQIQTYTTLLSTANILISSTIYARNHADTRLFFAVGGAAEVAQEGGGETVYAQWIVDVGGSLGAAVTWARRGRWAEGLVVDVRRIICEGRGVGVREGVLRAPDEWTMDNQQRAEGTKKETAKKDNAKTKPTLTVSAGVKKNTGRIGHPRNRWGRMIKSRSRAPEPEERAEPPPPAAVGDGRRKAGVSTMGEETASCIPPRPQTPPPKTEPASEADDSDTPAYIPTATAPPSPSSGRYHCTYPSCPNNNSAGYRSRPGLAEHVQFSHIHPHKYKCPSPKRGCRRGWPSKLLARRHYRCQHRKGRLGGEELEAWLRGFEDAEPSGIESVSESSESSSGDDDGEGGGGKLRPDAEGWYHCPYPGCPDNNGDGYPGVYRVGQHIRKVHTERYKYQCPEPIEGLCLGWSNREAVRRHYRARHRGGALTEQELEGWLAGFEVSE